MELHRFIATKIIQLLIILIEIISHLRRIIYRKQNGK
jgi:hypothetical protein